MKSDDEELEPDVMQIEPSIASTTNINGRKRAAEKAPYSTPKKPREAEDRSHATSGTPNRIVQPQTPSSITKKMGTLTFLTPVTPASVPNTPQKTVDIFAKPTASRHLLLAINSTQTSNINVLEKATENLDRDTVEIENSCSFWRVNG
uniref:Uncharacterized protein n=1 Tax=Panagrolaimus sp. ES5 TaxID=591445 RepID=A0AC34GKN9_9BILA